MIDRNGADVVVGDRVRFYIGKSTRHRPPPQGKDWAVGWVRRINGAECMVDNGKRDDPDLKTNGFHQAGWYEAGQIELDVER